MTDAHQVLVSASILNADFTHGYCPECAQKVIEESRKKPDFPRQTAPS